MAAPLPGITNITATTKGLAFVHAAGGTLLPRGTPGYNYMLDLTEMAEAEAAGRILAKQRAIADAQPKTKPAAQPDENPGWKWTRGLASLMSGKKDAPTSMRVLFTEDSPQPANPQPASPSARAPLGTSFLFMHHWEIVEAKNGHFVRGKIAGHPHLPDATTIETPALKSFDRDNNIFILNDGTAVSLGQIRPGVENKQTQLLNTVQSALAPVSPPAAESMVAAPKLSGIHVTGTKLKMRFHDRSSFSLAPHHPISLVFSQAAREIQKMGVVIDWTGAGIVQPQPAANPAPAAPKASIASKAPRAAAPADISDEMEAAHRDVAHEPVPPDIAEQVASALLPAAKSPAPPPPPAPPEQPAPKAPAPGETYDRMIVARILKCYEPREGGLEDFLFRVQIGNAGARVAAAPKDFGRALAAVHAAGLVEQVLGEPDLDNAHAFRLSAALDTNSKALKWEDVAALAKPLLEKRTEPSAAAPKPSASAPQFIDMTQQPASPSAEPTP